MWPKRKKSKARATKLKLKAMQAPNEQQGQQQESQDFDDPPETATQVEPTQDPRSQQDDLVSGVWKSKVLNNYKQNPKNSHNLLARIPTGKAAFEAGERQKAELIKEAMIKVVDRMFDNFQNTAYEFNQVTGGTNLELSWIRPHFVQEEVSNWHDSSKVTYDVFVGRISTRYWTLAVRGTATAVDTYILPSEKLLGFSTTPSNYPTYLSLVAECDGLSVDWLVAKKTLDLEILPSVYRALLDGLIRFASEEALPGETFRLEDIGIVPEATAPAEEPLGYQSVDKHDLLGQSSARNKVVSPRISSPRISSVSGSSSADRFIDNISNQVAQAAQNETDRFRESMQAPPFGTSTRAPGDMSQSAVMRASSPPQDFQQVEAAESDGGSNDDGEWKSVASDQVVRSDWQKYMEATKQQVKQQAKAMPATEDNWNSLPGTEKLARTEPRGAQSHMSNSQVMPGAQMHNSQSMQGVPYPSYGNSADPPELLRPADQAPTPTPTPTPQSGGYPNYPGLSQSGVNSVQHAALSNQQVSNSQSGVNSAQQSQAYPNQQGINQSGVHAAQNAQPTAYANSQAINQSGAFSTQQSGVFSAQQPQLPPPMMPPGYNQPMGMPQQPQMMQPGMANHPGLPSMPGMINPTLGQSGVHQQPRLPEPFQKAVPPQGLIAPPPGMIQMTPPQGMSPAAPVVPPQMVPGYPGDPHQPAPGSVAARYAEQQRVASLQGQYTTGGQQALPPQYDTGRQQAIPPQHNNLQPALPPQYNTGPQPTLPPPYNVGAQQSPSQYNTDAHMQLQLQYAQGGYGTSPVQESQSGAEESESYLLSESDVDEQAEQYPEEFPSEEQAEEEGWQPEEEQSEEVEIEEVEIELEVEEAAWEETANSAFSNSAFPQESVNELPVMSTETLQKFEAANKAGFVFSSENDLVDAISVVLDTIDSQIELLAQQGTEAFRQRDFRRAESIIKLSERLTSFKSESQAILQLMSGNEQ